MKLQRWPAIAPMRCQPPWSSWAWLGESPPRCVGQGRFWLVLVWPLGKEIQRPSKHQYTKNWMSHVVPYVDKVSYVLLPPFLRFQHLTDAFELGQVRLVSSDAPMSSFALLSDRVLGGARTKYLYQEDWLGCWDLKIPFLYTFISFTYLFHISFEGLKIDLFCAFQWKF